MKYLLIITLILSLILVSCDRFEREFTDLGGVDLNTEFFLPLQHAFDIITVSDLSAIEDFYATDYLHNGVNKSERITWLQSFLNLDPNASFSVSDQSFAPLDEDNYVANWRLTISGLDREILADSLFVGERIIRQNDAWLFYGNQTCLQNTDKQLVIAQYFTFRTCPNCPPAEEKLQLLQQLYPDNFIYLEHHTMLELAVPGDATNQYYQAYSSPNVVFQGIEKVSGGNPDEVAQYQPIVENLITIDELIGYEITDLEIQGNTISAVVHLQPHIDLPRENLVLNYVIITDEVEYTNAEGAPLHNVVRAVGSSSLAELDLGVGIPLELTGHEPLPQNFKLVVFAQDKPAVFQNNATIYSGIVKSVSQSR